MSEWPLIGRARQLRWVDEKLALTTGSGGIVIAGPAGVGKTRLAREALAARAAAGAVTRWVTASMSAQLLPLGAFAEVLKPPAVTDGSSLEVLRQAAADLAGLAGPGDGPVVVGVDDAHLLDVLSAALLHHVAGTGRVSLVVTVRSGATSPDAVVALWKEHLYPRLDLEPLTQEETVQLVGAVLGGPADRPTLDGLWRLSGGNPMLLQELVHGGRESGALALRNGMWSWHGSMAEETSLLRMVTERVEAVPPAEREVLELLALSEPLALEVLAELVPVPLLDTVERAGLVSVVGEGRRRRVRLAHPLYGDALLAALSPERARARCVALAKVMGRDPGGEPYDVVMRALLELAAGEAVDANLAEAAALHAGAALDHQLAERLARAAVAAGGGTRPRFLLANAVLWQGRLAEADQHLAELEATDLSHHDRARVAAQRAGLLFWSLDRPRDAEDALRRALDAVTDEQSRLELVGQRACFLAFGGELAEAVGAARQVMASDIAEPSAVVWAAMGGTLAQGLIGRWQDAVAMADRGRAALAAGPPEMAQLGGALVDAECTALRLAGRVTGAATRADELVAWATAEANSTAVAAAVTLQAQVELTRGGLTAAAALFREAVAGLAHFDPGGWRYHCHLGLAEVAAVQGDVAAARASLAAARALRPTARPVFRPKELLVECWVEGAAGDVRRAVAAARASADAARELGTWAMESLALHAVLRLSSAPQVADRLVALAGMVENPLVAAHAAHAVALASGDGRSQDQVGVRFEQMELLLVAADAYAHAAQALAGRGADRALSLRAAARSRALLRRCDAAPTVAAAQLPAAPSFTSRERQVATLASSGRPNKAIATELGVSVRTVEGHLAQVYAKLAVHRRDDLAAAMQAVDD